MNDKLINHIKNISEIFPWYQGLIQDINFSKIKLCDLPMIDGELLNKHYYSDLSNFPDAKMYLTSGTSSGHRKKIFYSKDDHKKYLQHRRNIFNKYISATCQIACSDLGTGHAADSADYIFRSLGLHSYKIDYSSPLEHHISTLNSIRPDVLYTMPMILQKLINSDLLKISPKKIFLVGDVATKLWQENVANYFGISPKDIIDLYGSIEIGSIAHFNHELDLYQIEDHIIPEVIDLGNGTSNLILTSMARSYFPAIRFNTNDIVSNFHCIKSKDKKLWVFERLIGRRGEDYKLGEKISFYDILHCIEKIIPNTPFNISEANYSIKIFFPHSKINNDLSNKLLEALKKINADINRMIASNLISDFEIIGIEDKLIDDTHFKRKIKHINLPHNIINNKEIYEA